MRNLKRALSLGLASVMLVGMMATGAGAVSYDDLTDKDEIVNQEAVQMLVELGVIDGKDDGSFDPTGIVTRAEMAKMICIVLNGGSDPNLGTTVSNSYTDTVGHWAAGYIEYCTQLGIVSGDGTGAFNPSGTVTGAEAAKMLLVALGYLSSAEGFTGSNWAVAVNVRANQKGLYNDLNINANEGLTRDNAAQMIYNALDADMVQYDYTLVTDGTSLSSSPTLEDKTDSNGNTVTLLANYFNAVRLEGVVVANEYANLNTSGSLDEGKTRIYVTNYDDQGYYEDGSTDFSLTTELEDLGRSVVLYVEKDSNSSNAEILGSTIDSGDNLVVLDYSSDTIDEVADDNNLDLIYSGDDRTQVVYNYGGAEGLTSSVATTDYLDGSNTNAGIEKYLIDNDDDGEVEYVLLNTYAFGRVTSYVTSGSGSITVRAGESGTFSKSDMDDVVGFDDVAKDDYVLVAEIGGRLFVEVADTVTGELEAYEGSDPVTTLTVDGTDYKVSDIPGYTDGDDDIRDASNYDNISLDSEATFYLGKGSYIAAIGDAVDSAYDYALVMAEGSSTLEDRVRVALSDGTAGTYDLNDNSDDPEVGEVYSYSINSSGEIRLTEVDADNYESLGETTFTKGRTTIRGNSTYYASSSTVFFYVSDDDILDEDGDPTTLANAVEIDDVSVYTGYSSAPSLDDGVTGYVYTRGDSTSTRAAAVLFTGDSLTTADVDDTLYVADTGTSTSDYTNATVFIAGEAEAQDIRVDSGSLEPKTGKVYTYTINSDGYYELDDDNFETGENYCASKYVASSNSDTFVLEDVDDDFVITSDTLFVDDSDYLDDPVGELGAGPDEGDYVTHVVYGDNDDREVIMVVISNEEADGDDDDYVGDDSVSGTNNSILTTEGVEADSVRLSSGGTLTYSFYAPEGYTTSDTVDYYYEVYVEGDLYTYGSVTGASISSSGLVSGSVSDIDYDDGDEVEIVVTEVELVEDDTDATYTVTLSGYDAGTYSLYLNNRAVEPVENRGSLTVEAEEGDELTVESSTLTAGATYDVGLSELVTVDSSNGFTVTVDSSLTLSEPVRTAELAALETDSSADLPAGVTAITAEFESAPDTVQAEDALTITFALEGEFTGTAEGAVAAEITAEGAEISGDTSVEVISAGGSGLAETEITVTIDEITGNTVTLSVDFS